MIDGQNFSNEYRTALHEAGHAVAFYRLFPNCTALGVTIVKRGDDLGTFTAEDVSYENSGAPDEVLEETLHKHAVYCCAGYAVVLTAGFDEVVAVEGCEPDFHQAGEFLAVGKTGAKDLFADAHNMDAARFLADELMVHRSMDGDWAAMAIEVGLGMATDNDYRAYLAMSGPVRI